jgi:probable phosphoglycerate mutase
LTLLLVRHGESAPALPDQPFALRDGHGDPELDPVGNSADEFARTIKADVTTWTAVAKAAKIQIDQ